MARRLPKIEQRVGVFEFENVQFELDVTYQITSRIQEALNQTTADVAAAAQYAAQQTLSDLHENFVDEFLQATGIRFRYVAERRVLPLHTQARRGSGRVSGAVAARAANPAGGKLNNLGEIFIGTAPVNVLAFVGTAQRAQYQSYQHPVMHSGDYEFILGKPRGLNPYLRLTDVGSGVSSDTARSAQSTFGTGGHGGGVVHALTKGGNVTPRRRIHRAVQRTLGRQVARASRGGMGRNIPIVQTFERRFLAALGGGTF